VGAAIASSVTHRQSTVSLFSLILIVPPTNLRFENNNRMASACPLCTGNPVHIEKERQ
jgi:hypothetical protein